MKHGTARYARISLDLFSTPQAIKVKYAHGISRTEVKPGEILATTQARVIADLEKRGFEVVI